MRTKCHADQASHGLVSGVPQKSPALPPQVCNGKCVRASSYILSLDIIVVG